MGINQTGARASNSALNKDYMIHKRPFRAKMQKLRRLAGKIVSWVQLHDLRGAERLIQVYTQKQRQLYSEMKL
uniref:Uncharacterized protein n=1 Tax=Rhizophora mucronata TaxID=61149 RepID=A0A2P2PA82_RHIMU